MSKHNKPLDRDYFKRKKNPDWDAKQKLTECCEQPIDHEVLNVFKKSDWEQIEEHVRQQLYDYPNTETITPLSPKHHEARLGKSSDNTHPKSVQISRLLTKSP